MTYLNTIHVLDRGFVRLVDCMGSDLTVVNAARVSFASQSEYEDGNLSEKDKKLINYLARHNHWTPFAHATLTMHIKAPISIRTQFFKHKVGFVENEISRRYVSDEVEFYVPQFRSKPSASMKQGSSGFLAPDDHNKAVIAYGHAAEAAQSTYRHLLNIGVAPEQARFVLPQGIYTEWYWTGSLSAYARFFKQRSDPHAQYEIREYAKAISEIIPKDKFQYSWNALVNTDYETDTQACS